MAFSFCNVFTLAPYSNFSFYQIDAAKPIPEVFEDVKAIFAPYSPKVIRFYFFFWGKCSISRWIFNVMFALALR
jgi:hypothetical protein